MTLDVNFVIHIPINSENTDLAPVLSKPCIKSDTQLQVNNLISTDFSNVIPPKISLSAFLVFISYLSRYATCSTIDYVIYIL